MRNGAAASDVAQAVEGVKSVKNDLQAIGASAKASEMARRVPGVKSVKNELTFTR